MNTNELLRSLALGELSNLSLVEAGDTITPSKIPQIIKYANDGLLRLYTRFVLKENDLMLAMREGVTNYHLLTRYAESQAGCGCDLPPGCEPYILDTQTEPFMEDVIKVMSVFDSLGNKLPINDLEQAWSVFTPQSTILQVPEPIPLQSLAVEYQASHPILSENCMDQCIELPSVLYQALTAYIAGKVYSNMNTQENLAVGQVHLVNYEGICQDVIDKDIVNTSSSTTNSKFDKMGWV